MGFERSKWRRVLTAAALSTLAATAQPPTKPNQESTKPAGVRDSLEKLRSSEKKRLARAEHLEMLDDSPPRKQNDTEYVPRFIVRKSAENS